MNLVLTSVLKLLLPEDVLEVLEHAVHLENLLLLLPDLLHLFVVDAPDDAVAFGIRHVDVPLEVFIDVLPVGRRVEDLDLQSHEVVREGLQDDEHDAAHDHLVNIVYILDPDVLEPNDVLPAPLDAQVLVSV